MGMMLGYVEDIADGVLLAFDKGEIGESYVLAGEQTTMDEIISRTAELAGPQAAADDMPTPPDQGHARRSGRWSGRRSGFPPNLGRAGQRLRRGDLLGQRREGPPRARLPAPRPGHGARADDRRQRRTRTRRAAGARPAAPRRGSRSSPAGRSPAGRSTPSGPPSQRGVTDRVAVGAQAAAAASSSSMRRCQRSPPSSMTSSASSSSMRIWMPSGWRRAGSRWFCSAQNTPSALVSISGGLGVGAVPHAAGALLLHREAASGSRAPRPGAASSGAGRVGATPRPASIASHERSPARGSAGPPSATTTSPSHSRSWLATSARRAGLEEAAPPGGWADRGRAAPRPPPAGGGWGPARRRRQ